MDYAMNKALYEARKARGISTDDRRFNGFSGRITIDEWEDDSEVLAKIDELENKIDLLGKMVHSLINDPPVRELVTPIIVLADSNSSIEKLEDDLRNVIIRL